MIESRGANGNARERLHGEESNILGGHDEDENVDCGSHRSSLVQPVVEH